MADAHHQARAPKPKQSRKQAKEDSLPLLEPRPSTSGQQTFKEKGHRHASKGRSEKPKASKAAEQDEYRRDRALQKLCEKSAHNNTGARVTQEETGLDF